jgi:ankyrin repeat protein
MEIDFKMRFLICLFLIFTSYNLVSKTEEENLFYSIMNGYLEGVKISLARKANVNLANIYGDTPLILAARHGQSGIVLTLLENKALINKKNNYGYTTLHSAAVVCIANYSIGSGKYGITHILP